MNREYFYEESTGTTTASDGGVTKVTMYETVTAGETWFYFSTCSANQADATTFQVNLVLADAGFTIEHHIQPKDVADYFSCPIVAVDTAGSGFVNATIDLINDTVDGIGTDTYNIREASIFALKKHELDQYAGGDGSSATTSSTTYADLEELTFVVPSAGDYLIIAMASCKKDTTASNFTVKLVIDGTDYAIALMRSVSTLYDQPFFDHAVVNLSAGSKTIKIQGHVATSGTLTASNLCILAIRLDTFPWYTSSTDRDQDTTDQVTYQTTLNPSYRLQEKPMWLLSSCLGSKGNNTTSGQVRTLYDSTTIQETSNEPSVGTGENCHMAQSVFTPSGVEHTSSAQFKDDGGATTARISEEVITLVQLSSDATVWIKGATILGGSIL